MPKLYDAAASGDRRATLVALRDSIARTIEGTESGRDVAALSKRLMEVMAEIEALPDPSASSPVSRSRSRAASRKREADG